MYEKYVRPILFKTDPERIHNLTIFAGRVCSSLGMGFLLKWMFDYKGERLRGKVMGIEFENPIGLAAGFDKNAHLVDFVPDLGFGFIEVGSITAKANSGNPKPRLHRLVNDRAVIVNYGLANQGAEKIHKRLEGRKFKIPVGVSIAKTNDPLIKGKNSVEDYFKGFQIMKDIGDYVTINISCPNVGDARSFEDPKLLEALLKKIAKVRKKEKILLKISPDIDKKSLDVIIGLVEKYKINGLIVSNLTKNREGLTEDKNLKFSGGVSGKAVSKKSNEMIKYVYKKTKGELVIVGCGGIFSGKDAYDKIKSGASLVQLITGMIYGGPGAIGKINKELDELLKKDGYKNVGDAVGTGV